MCHATTRIWKRHDFDVYAGFKRYYLYFGHIILFLFSLFFFYFPEGHDIPLLKGTTKRKKNNFNVPRRHTRTRTFYILEWIYTGTHKSHLSLFFIYIEWWDYTCDGKAFRDYLPSDWVLVSACLFILFFFSFFDVMGRWKKKLEWSGHLAISYFRFILRDIEMKMLCSVSFSHCKLEVN